ncbi:hypothetical protein D5039_21505, partial [Verminephrobacter aporrectodeae subsp. tuberculatae]|nr:hypothetical protein [Verminephrobacter aporrectodeae subsp. tuberculatae]
MADVLDAVRCATAARRSGGAPASAVADVLDAVRRASCAPFRRRPWLGGAPGGAPASAVADV